MIIVLDKPYSLGDLSNETYPHVYASRLLVDGRAQSVHVSYEYGRMEEDGTWVPTPIPTGETIILTGEALIPFFFTRPVTLDASLWDQTETVVYEELQSKVPRLNGSIHPAIYAADAMLTEASAPPAQLSLNLAQTSDLLHSLPILNTFGGAV